LLVSFIYLFIAHDLPFNRNRLRRVLSWFYCWWWDSQV